MLELAIFGSMVIMVLGALVSYGMNADLQQRTQMQAIRDAMWSGARSQRNDVPDSLDPPDEAHHGVPFLLRADDPGKGDGAHMGVDVEELDVEFRMALELRPHPRLDHVVGDGRGNQAAQATGGRRQQGGDRQRAPAPPRAHGAQCIILAGALQAPNDV